MRPALILMTKAPRPGAVKTRLVPPLTPGEAAELSACFIRDTAALARTVDAALVVGYAPEKGRPDLEPLVGQADHWAPQEGADLGERQEYAITRAAARGYGPLLVIGSDTPSLPPSFLTEGLEMLGAGTDVVLGPTEDGGYYLLGLRQPILGLFADVAWSTDAVADRIETNVQAARAQLGRLPAWYDVDTPEDLGRLTRDLSSNPGSAPATAEWLLSRVW